MDINTLRAAQSEIRKDASGNILASPNKSKISTTVATINESSEPVTEDASGGKAGEQSKYFFTFDHHLSIFGYFWFFSYVSDFWL